MGEPARGKIKRRFAAARAALSARKIGREIGILALALRVAAVENAEERAEAVAHQIKRAHHTAELRDEEQAADHPR